MLRSEKLAENLRVRPTMMKSVDSATRHDSAADGQRLFIGSRILKSECLCQDLFDEVVGCAFYRVEVEGRPFRYVAFVTADRSLRPG